MSKSLPAIDDGLRAWIADQHVFFVATAPRGDDGHVNLSPKGGDSLRVLSPTEIAYCDYTGSGIETAAHLRENGRIVVMWCAFTGPPRIVRVHGRGRIVLPGEPEGAGLAALFPPHPGIRLFIRIAAERISSSCGFSVPLMDFRGDRDVLDAWSQKKGPEGLAAYRREKNARSIDGMPGMPRD